MKKLLALRYVRRSFHVDLQRTSRPRSACRQFPPTGGTRISHRGISHRRALQSTGTACRAARRTFSLDPATPCSPVARTSFQKPRARYRRSFRADRQSPPGRSARRCDRRSRTTPSGTATALRSSAPGRSRSAARIRAKANYQIFGRVKKTDPTPTRHQSSYRWGRRRRVARQRSAARC